ncbi:MAG: hypothetical protein MUP71_12620 [Candidatus Aminicenantes bacterium]|nr:hypothetical protein [Candidatus Aminicenantes bacterium]
MKNPFLFSLILTAFLVVTSSKSMGSQPLDQLAEDYVKLALVLGAYAPGYIDAYYGPEAWVVKHDDSVLRRGFPASELRKKANSLIKSLDAAARSELSALEKLRCEFLGKQMIALKAEIDVLSGIKFSFDQESKLFYDAVAPVRRREEFERTITALEGLLPGNGSLIERITALRKDFIIPADKLPAVFDAAISECRRRTLAHIALPQNENFKAEYVKNKPWGAYNWYKGSAFSVIEVNTDLPMDISGPLRLAAHEGYPGHHVYNALLEQKLVKERGWIEFTVYPLFSPQSLIAEGTANYGMELLFSAEERMRFEKDVLYPLAGLDPRQAAKFAQVRKLIGGLRYAENEAARGYLDGRISKEDAIEWLTRYALESPERAAKSIDFWKQYRSYIINYNLGQDVIRNYMEETAGTDHSLKKKWEIFYDILSTPRTPSGLSELGRR